MISGCSVPLPSRRFSTRPLTVEWRKAVMSQASFPSLLKHPVLYLENYILPWSELFFHIFLRCSIIVLNILCVFNQTIVGNVFLKLFLGPVKSNEYLLFLPSRESCGNWDRQCIIRYLSSNAFIKVPCPHRKIRKQQLIYLCHSSLSPPYHIQIVYWWYPVEVLITQENHFLWRSPLLYVFPRLASMTLPASFACWTILFIGCIRTDHRNNLICVYTISKPNIQ